ncbi:MAG: hypothetical protein CMG75_01735 [Candidatus Marinimicrobia bacterium]|nr:hypothetical protein [Candidatus Neomarinimicrobiota bacterium]|tara:strand:- start:1966 stop:2841 length:876 start_codon:yes stop_codon:yes gene_type:complete
MKILFIVNPTSGRGKAAKKIPKLETLLKAKKVDYELVKTTKSGHAKNIAFKRRADFDVVAVFGGDGTMNEVLNGLVGGNTPMAIVPIGTGNDFARSANLPMKMNEAIDGILNGKTVLCDIGFFNKERYFINVIGIGFDAFANIQSRKIKRIRGTMVYVVAVFKTLRLWSSVKMRIEMDDIVINDLSYLTCIANGWSVGGGLSLAPDANLHDGFFDICHVSDIKAGKIIRHFTRLINGKINNFPEVSLSRSKKVRITSKQSLPMHLDGEIIEGDNKEFDVEIIPNGFTLWRS